MKDSEIAKKILEEYLLDSATESYGVSHQLPYIEFRKQDDVTITFDTIIKIEPDEDLQQLNLAKEEYELLCLHKVNPVFVTGLDLKENNDLYIQFANGRTLFISGEPEDISCSEPWQFSTKTNNKDDKYLLMVAMRGGGIALWDTRNNEE